MNFAVKFIPVLLAATLVAQAGAPDPGGAAIDFLEKVRERKLDLKPGGDTALSPQTAEEKQQQIAKRLERIARDLGSDPLEVGSVREDENFAAVLVRKVGGFDPSRIQVFPIAMVKKGTDWLAAPVPASFENSGTGYALTLRNRLDELEDWMLREQVTDLQKLRDESATKMRGKIAKHLPIERLKQMSPEDMCNEFLAACGKKDTATLLGLLGGLGTSIPDDWQLRLNAVEKAMAAEAGATSPWNLFTDSRVLKVAVNLEESASHGSAAIVCLDPTGGSSTNPKPRFHVVNLDLMKGQEGLWQINLPQSFFLPGDDSEDGDDLADSETINRFPSLWSKVHATKPSPTADAAMEAVIHGLHSESPKDLLQMCNLGGTPGASPYACIRACELWWTLRDPATLRHAIPIAVKAEGNVAIGIFQTYSGRNPDQFDARAVYFEKSPGGWLWTPTPDKDSAQEFKSWADAEIARAAPTWQPQFLSAVPVLEKALQPQAPTTEEARDCVEKYLSAIAKGDLPGAISLIALLPEQKSGFTALQNIGYEIMAARRSRVTTEIGDSHKGKFWTTVGTRSGKDLKSDLPFYPVVATPAGPRILIEIDLFISSSRSRQFLNKTSLERLDKSVGAEVKGDLQSLFTRYEIMVTSGKPND